MPSTWSTPTQQHPPLTLPSLPKPCSLEAAPAWLGCSPPWATSFHTPLHSLPAALSLQQNTSSTTNLHYPKLHQPCTDKSLPARGRRGSNTTAAAPTDLFSMPKEQKLSALRPWCSTLNQQLLDGLLGGENQHPGTAFTNRKHSPSKALGKAHLEGEVHGTVPNLVDVWQGATIVLATALAQLQVLGFLQL